MSNGDELLEELRKAWMASEGGFFYRLRGGDVSESDVDGLIQLLEEICKHVELLGRRDSIILTWRIPSYLQIHGKFLQEGESDTARKIRNTYGRIDELVSRIVEG